MRNNMIVHFGKHRYRGLFYCRCGRGGDTKFQMYMNLISTWGIVMPLSFLAAFVWKLPVEWVVVAVQSDQLFKCVPVFLRFRSYKWIRKLT